MRSGGEPHLDLDRDEPDARDVEALRAIGEHGSMHRTATELGRSYSRSQQSVVELEETPLRVLVTGTSLDTLDLHEGVSVVASFKATATRAIPQRRRDE